MEQNPYLQLLREVFRNPVLVDEISSLSPARIPADTILLKEGEYVKLIPLVLEGSVRVIREDESGKEILLYKIATGESCALSISAILNEQKSRAVAITETEITAYLIPADKVRKWMLSYKGWYRFVLNLYNNRFAELLDTIDSIAFSQMDERLIALLKKLSDNKVPAGIRITHQQLANELATAREVITRLVKKLEKDGLIRSERGKITIIASL